MQDESSFGATKCPQSPLLRVSYVELMSLPPTERAVLLVRSPHSGVASCILATELPTAVRNSTALGPTMARRLRMGQFEVDASDLLGHGGFGRVFKGRDTTTGTILAVKEQDPRRVSRDKILLEVQIMELVTGHPSFIAILGAQELESGEIYIFMELAAGELRVPSAVGRRRARLHLRSRRLPRLHTAR